MRRPRAKTFKLAAVTAASAAVTAACGLSNASDTASLTAGPTGTPITVGISLPLTGDFAADGQACLNGYHLWVSDINSHGGLLGRPVKLVVLNNKSDEPTVKAQYRTLITQDHVNLTLAPFSSLLTIDAAGVTNQYHYALFAGQAGAPGVYALKYNTIFSTNVPVVNQMKPFANWVVNMHGHPLTAAYPMVSDPFADPPVMATMKTFRNAGIQTAYSAPAGANPGYTDVKPAALAADARKVANSHAGIVVLGSVDVPTVQAFIRVWEAVKYQPKIFIAAAGPDQGQAFLNAIGTGNSIGIMVPNGWYGGYPNALSHVMVQNYIAKYGGTASSINADVAESYSAAQVMAATVTATHGTDQAKLIAYAHGHSFQTVLGPVKFSQYGENTNAEQSALIFQWQPGAGGTGAKFVQVLPAPPKPGSVPIIPAKPAWAGG